MLVWNIVLFDCEYLLKFKGGVILILLWFLLFEGGIEIGDDGILILVFGGLIFFLSIEFYFKGVGDLFGWYFFEIIEDMEDCLLKNCFLLLFIMWIFIRYDFRFNWIILGLWIGLFLFLELLSCCGKVVCFFDWNFCLFGVVYVDVII